MTADDLDDSKLLKQLVVAYRRLSSRPEASPGALQELEQLELEALKRHDLEAARCAAKRKERHT